jgi:hypothetical protein
MPGGFVLENIAMAIKHLESEYIDDIVLGLDEDVYGANGDFNEHEIKQRLIENIHRRTDHQYAFSGRMPVWAVADLIRSVWEYMDRKAMAMIEPDNFPD